MFTDHSERVAPTLTRVIDGCLFARHPDPTGHVIRVHDLGHGHLEALVMPSFSWGEVDALSPLALSDAAMGQGNIWVDGAWATTPPESQRDKFDRLTRNRERSTRRARTKVRRLCKARGLTTMLTLTYRENMTDRQRMGRDFDVFIKRVRRVVPDLQYLCVFERQKRGAWHAHIAVPRVLSHYLHRGRLVRSYDLLRSLWRAVVGVGNGNVDVSRNKRVARSAAKLAAYMSKYIGKDFGALNSEGDSYRASGRSLPPPVCIPVSLSDLHAASSAMFALIDRELSTMGEFHQAFLDGGGYFFCLSK